MENDILKVSRKEIRIFSTVMMVLFSIVIILIQNTDSKISEKRMEEKIQLARQEERAIADRDSIMNSLGSNENKVIKLTNEVHSYRNDVQASTKKQEQSLNNFNNLKKQNEKVYIPNATVEQQFDFLSKYKYTPIASE